ncbi:MAG: hypothetical protein M1817_004411 [Caeruleum heppii]|nr:MAG: hypothetical protein M1817_004411 [Caeruleum heppii]
MTADLESIRAKATCNICIRLLYEPYTLGCGHTFCYSCLCQWFDGKKMNKTCPECRSKVTERPAPAYLVKDIVEIFINRLDMMPAGETVEQHRKWRSEDVKLVERDKANTDRKTGGLFRGAFSSKPRLHAFRDEGDGVHRCPLCAWELEDGRCEQCGVAVDSEGLVVSDDDEEDTDSFPSSVGSAFNNARRANRTMDRSRRGRTGRSQTSESEASPMRHDHPWHLAALERMARQPVPIVDEDMVSMTGEDDMIMDDEVDDVDDDDEEDEDEASWLSSSMRDFLDDDDSDHSTNADSLAADRASNVPAVSVRSGQTDTDSRDHAGTHNVQSSVAVQIDDSDEEGTISTNTRRARATPRLYVMSRRGTRAMRVAVSSSSDTEPDDGDLGSMVAP